MAIRVNKPAEMRPTLSPKLSRPMANPPRMMVKLSQERKVRSLAKKTLGSTRVGREMRFPVKKGKKGGVSGEGRGGKWGGKGRE